MQGINKAKHIHLTEAMFQLERLLSKKEENSADLYQTEKYRKELEKMYENYHRLLTEVSHQIDDYEDLYIKVKTQYLGKKLKKLKKEIPEQEPSFVRLIENIHTIYGT